MEQSNPQKFISQKYTSLKIILMLTEYIQFKVIKSHPNLQRQSSPQFYDAKLSLQLPRYNAFDQNRLKKKIIVKQNVNAKLNLYDYYLDQIQNKENFEPNRQLKFINSNYLKEKQNILSQQNYLMKSNSRISLISSPKKVFILSHQQTSIAKKNPLIRSSNSKEICEKNNESNSILSNKLRGSLRNYSLHNTNSQQNFLKGGQNIFKGTQQSNGKKCLFKTMSHHNLSPLKKKLSQITNSTNLQNLNKKQTNQGSRRILQHSDSFRKVISMNRQRKKQFNQNELKSPFRQINRAQLNQQYYVVDQNQKQNAGFQSKSHKLIKNPQRRLIQLKKHQKIQSIKTIQMKITTQKLSSKQIKFQQKKNESFIEQNVNNSNMFSFFRQDEKQLNMEPY